MTRSYIAVLAIALFLLGTSAPAHAQRSAPIGPDEAAAPSVASLDAVRIFETRESNLEASKSSSFIPLPSYGGWVGVTKWATLAAATGLGSLGFILHAEASDKFDALTRRCNANPDVCRELNPDGSYADPQLESLFQDAVDRDNQARVALVAAEVSFGLSVLLFIVDFQKDTGPNNIPYDPEEEQASLDVELQPDGIWLKYYIN